MDVHTIWKVGQRNHIDIVGWIRRGRLHCGSLYQTRETLTVAIDGIVNEVAPRRLLVLIPFEGESGVVFTHTGTSGPV